MHLGLIKKENLETWDAWLVLRVESYYGTLLCCTQCHFSLRRAKWSQICKNYSINETQKMIISILYWLLLIYMFNVKLIDFYEMQFKK